MIENKTTEILDNNRSIDYKEINAKWHKSGLPQVRFCKKNNISYSGLKKWRSDEIRAGRITSLKSKSLFRSQGMKEEKKFLPINIAAAQENCSVESANKLVAELELPQKIILRIYNAS